MLKISSVTAIPAGTRMEGFAVVPPSSKRAAEIAKSREELLQLLHDLPESEFELSLTDLVEKGPASTAADSNTSLDEGRSNRAPAVKKRKKEIGSNKRRSFRSRSDGVLLKFYMPASLTRSLTAPRPGGGALRGRGTQDCNERDGDATTFGCWSALWNRRGKPRRQVLEKMS